MSLPNSNFPAVPVGRTRPLQVALLVLVAAGCGSLVAQPTPRASTAAGSATLDEGVDGTDSPVVRSIGPPAGAPLTGDALDDATYTLADELRCPVCQGLSVAASPSPSALAMRAEIRELLAQGYSEEQVVDYFEGAYGEFVRLVPKAEGFNLLVWIVPGVGLLLGLALVWKFTRPDDGARVVEQQTANEPELDPWLEQVQREVAGDLEPKREDA